MKKLIYIIAVLAALSAMLSWARSPKSSWDTDALRRKADYAYLEAQARQLDDARDDYFALLQHAVATNPADLESADDYGATLVSMLLGNDSVGVQGGLDMMKRLFDSGQGDEYSDYRYFHFMATLGDSAETARSLNTLHQRYPTRDNITLMLVRNLAMSGDSAALARALLLTDTLQTTASAPFDVAVMKCNILLSRGDTAAVLREAHRVLNLNPRAVQNNLFMSFVFDGLAMPDSQGVYLKRAVELDPGDPEARYQLANYYGELGDSAAYDREVFKVLDMDDIEMDAKLQVVRDYLGNLYQDTVQRPRINALLERLTTANPTEPRLNSLFGTFLFLENNISGAAEQMERAVALDPSDLSRWSFLASLYMQDDKGEKARDAYSRALSYFPSEAQLYMMRGTSFAVDSCFTPAMADLMKADSLAASMENPDIELRASILCTAGDVCQQLNPDSADTYYEQSLALNPDNPLTLNNYAYSLAVRDKDLDKALAMIEKSISLSEIATSMDTYAWVLFKRHDYAKAKEKIDLTFALSRQEAEAEGKPADSEISAELLEHAGDIYFMAGEPAQALTFWADALKLDPNNKLLKKKVRHKTYFYE